MNFAKENVPWQTVHWQLYLVKEDQRKAMDMANIEIEKCRKDKFYQNKYHLPRCLRMIPENQPYGLIKIVWVAAEIL